MIKVTDSFQPREKFYSVRDGKSESKLSLLKLVSCAKQAKMNTVYKPVVSSQGDRPFRGFLFKVPIQMRNTCPLKYFFWCFMVQDESEQDLVAFLGIEGCLVVWVFFPNLLPTSLIIS